MPLSFCAGEDYYEFLDGQKNKPLGIRSDQTKAVTGSHTYQTKIVLLWPHHKANRIITECLEKLKGRDKEGDQQTAMRWIDLVVAAMETTAKDWKLVSMFIRSP